MVAHDRYRIEPLGSHHDRAAFSCGVVALDRYFHQQAGQDMRRRVAVAFVIYDIEADAVAGYYTLSATTVHGTDLPVDAIRRLPRYPQLPAVLLGRFAIDSRYQGQGVGRILLIDALRRCLQVADQVGATFVLVDAKDEAARAFYERYGFRRFPDDEFRLFLAVMAIAQL